jgi:hypothetical protein
MTQTPHALRNKVTSWNRKLLCYNSKNGGLSNSDARHLPDSPESIPDIPGIPEAKAISS